jgi:MoaD family protein
LARLRLFAALRDAAGVSRDDFEASTVSDLLEQAKKRYGKGFSEALEFASIAVNGTTIKVLQGEATPLEEDDEVALLPPVSGGHRIAPA